MALKFFQPDTVLIDFRFDITVGGTGERHCDGAGAAVARQANYADIVGEIFTTKLRANAKFAAGIEQGLFKRSIAERLAQFIPMVR
ncbi:Uncharacterised protein [Salmonella enterica subsp. arizonae]|uniref:Uncharacterized protein n=1 Tax=Salmonella enterica subsp. arizonae TaxID=59203 RepID=A0A2X4WRB9_SALER|nr:Uncharacterised protein [Salmonella enterica subsp. arizonae]